MLSTDISDPNVKPRKEGPDHAESPGRMDIQMLRRFVEDLQTEPHWRREADICAEYYDGNQLDPETLQDLEDRGLGPLQRNVIKPTIDAVLGLEERTKTDWRVVSDFDDEAEVAEALSAKLMEAERNTRADTAISEAYAGQIKAGFAAVEVSRHSNPFEHPYRVQFVHRRELAWDPRSRRNDWGDARFIRRQRWYDVDIACAHFPAQKEILRYAVGGWDPFAAIDRLSDYDTSELARAMEVERMTSFEDLDWRDQQRKRVCISEIWYRVWHRGKVFRLPRGRVSEFNMANPQHLQLAQAGVIKPFDAVYDKIRCAFFAGPHRLADYGSTRRRFPYVPFWGYREDLTGAPYGMIRSMLSTQDEVNARLAKMMWLLSARRTLIDEDALAEEHNTMSDVAAEVGRSDAFIVLNANRRNADGLRVDENLQLAEAQRAALMDAIQSMQQVSGVYPAMMGQTSATTAARAIEKLVDQGTNTLAEINGNYAWGRKEVGNALLELVKEDLTQEMAVTIDTGVSKRSVYINRRTIDSETGVETIENGVKNTQAKVALADVPSSASYREQQFAQLSEITKSLPPDLQAIVMPFVLEATNLEKRKEIAKLIRDKLGLVDEKSDEGKARAEEMKQAEAAQAQQLAKQFDADLAEKHAKVAKLQAEADKIRAEIGQGAGDQADQLRQEYEQRTNELQKQLLSLEMDREIERTRIENEHAAKLQGIAAETDRKRMELDSQERTTALNQKTDKEKEDVYQAIKDLAEEIDDRLDEIKAQARDAQKGTDEKIKETQKQAKEGIKKVGERAKSRPK